MRNLTNSIFKRYYQQRYRRMQQVMKHPHDHQASLFKQLMEISKHTEWGKKFDYKSIKNAAEFAQRVPVQDYESLKPYIRRMMHGEKDVLWSGPVNMYSKSSGTTNDKSKYIPISKQNFKSCHIRGTWDTMTFLYQHKPTCKIFSGKNFLMAGSYESFQPYPKTIFGDVSALMIRQMPRVARPFFEPDFDTALDPEWESKIAKMTAVAIDKNIAPHVTMIGGVPSWVIVFFRQILEASGKENMLEVWPNFEAFIHGGVAINPYIEQLQQFLPAEHIVYHEVYNASEGYFATQHDSSSDDMLLLIDNGVYYEFLPMEEWHAEFPKTIPLSEVETGINYAMVITTNSGLWRYMIGDTVCFTSTDPYSIKVTGRTKQFVNTFGEEVIVSNTDKALAMTCQKMDVIVSEYTVAPIYFKDGDKGGHEWLIEFEKAPANIDLFNKMLDKNLQDINSDYEAKRYKNMALKQLTLRSLPQGTFMDWMRSKGKYSSQSKVPRLANDRKYIEEIISFIK